MAGQRPIWTTTTHEDVDLAHSTASLSEAIDLTTRAQNGIFSLQVEVETSANSTSMTVNAWLSNDGVNFVDEDSGGLTIVSAVDPSGSLDKIYSFEPKLSKWMKIEVVNNDAADALVDVTCTLAVQ